MLFGCIKDEKNQVNTKGIGLGLVISQLIVTNFNGTISFISVVNEGTEFTFTFQLDQQRKNQLIHPSKQFNSGYQEIELKGNLAKNDEVRDLSEESESSSSDIQSVDFTFSTRLSVMADQLNVLWKN